VGTFPFLNKKTMELIAFRPADDSHEAYHLWFRSNRGTISRTFVENKEYLRTTLFVAKNEANVEVFGLDFTPNYITSILKHRELER
jgi:hypothetical protein